jgi:hypothetical protein
MFQYYILQTIFYDLYTIPVFMAEDYIYYSDLEKSMNILKPGKLFPRFCLYLFTFEFLKSE